MKTTLLFTLLFFTCTIVAKSQCEEIDYGNVDPGYDTPASYGANYLLGTMHNVPEGGTIYSLNFFGLNTGSPVQMALYEDNAGVPGDLVVASEVGTVGDGAVYLTTDPTAITAGDYWFMAVYTNSGGHCYYTTDTDVDVYYETFTIGTTVPANIADYLVYSGQDFQYWLTLGVELDLSVNLDGTTLTSNQDGVSYQWIDCDDDNEPVIGANEQSFTPLVSGNYAVILANDDCIEFSNCINITITSVEDITLTQGYSVYPNPFLENVTFESLSNSDISEIRIYDLSGKLVYSQAEINFNKVTVDLDVESGIYLVTILDVLGREYQSRVSKN